jgi:hypothetical protein
VGLGGIGIHYEDEGATYPVTVDPLVWEVEAIFTGEEYGSGCFIDKDFAVYGGHPSTGFGANIHILARGPTSWQQTQKLVPSGSSKSDNFGSSVNSIAESNGLMAVGASGQSCVAGPNCGRCYFFKLEAGGWVEEGYAAGDELASAMFGTSVSMDGNSLAITSIFGNAGKGKAYVYSRY